MAKLILTPALVAGMLRDAGFVGWQVVRMGQIAMAESALNAYAVNVVDNPESLAHRSLDIGLLQINTYWIDTQMHPIAELLDPVENCQTAHDIFVARGGVRNPIDGYNAWTTYRTGAYMKWQTQALEASRQPPINPT